MKCLFKVALDGFRAMVLTRRPTRLAVPNSVSETAKHCWHQTSGFYSLMIPHVLRTLSKSKAGPTSITLSIETSIGIIGIVTSEYLALLTHLGRKRLEDIYIYIC